MDAGIGFGIHQKSVELPCTNAFDVSGDWERHDAVNDQDHATKPVCDLLSVQDHAVQVAHAAAASVTTPALVPGHLKNNEKVQATDHATGPMAPQSNAKDATGDKRQPLVVGDVPVVLQNAHGHKFAVLPANDVIGEEITVASAEQTGTAGEVPGNLSTTDDTAYPKKGLSDATNTTQLKGGILCTSVEVTKNRHNDELTCKGPSNILEAVPVQSPGYVLNTTTVASTVESTKAWVQRSFGASPATANALSPVTANALSVSATLTPTAQLVDICRPTRSLKKTPRQPHSTSKRTINSPIGSNTAMTIEDGSEPETYFLGDIFSDAQHGDKFQKVDGKTVHTPNTSGKHNWNVNAPEFLPKASPQVGPAVLQDDSDSYESEVSLPEDGSLPEDDVLLDRMDLYDMKGLLRRQNTPQIDLPSKIPIVPPDFVDSDPEYEDEDEFSISCNEIHTARIGALSPRVEEIKRPKNIIRKRAPLERRTQPSRSSKTKPTRSNDYVWQ